MKVYLAKHEQEDVDPSRPPLQEEIYIEHMDESGFVISAGNRTTTYWRLRLHREGDDPTSGTFGAIDVSKNTKWFGGSSQMRV